VLELARTSTGLQDSQLSELLVGIEAFWADRERRNRYIHDEWFPWLMNFSECRKPSLPTQSAQLNVAGSAGTPDKAEVSKMGCRGGYTPL
jgi:hypothetical protein